MKIVNKLKLVFIAFAAVFYLLPLPALAVDCNSSTAAAISCGTDSAAGVPSDNSTTAGGRIDTTVQNLINVLSIVVGIAAVIMLIVGGFRYITSAGNPEGIKAAKNTIMYALIGLVIVALAQFIVNFVLNKTTQQAAPPPSAGFLLTSPKEV